MFRVLPSHEPYSRYGQSHCRPPQLPRGRRFSLSPRTTQINMANNCSGLVGNQSTPPSTVPLQDLLKLHHSSLAASSRSRYLSVWRQWTTFRTYVKKLPIWLPPDSSTHSSNLFEFAHALWSGSANSPNSIPTIRQKLHIVSWHHVCMRGYGVSLTQHRTIQLKGMDRLRPVHHAKEQATVYLLHELRNLLSFSSSQDRVLWGSTVLAFFFLLRRSEYVAVHDKPTAHTIKVEDIIFRDKWNRPTKIFDNIHVVELQVRSSKTDQRGKGARLQLASSEGPIKAAWSLTQHAHLIGAKPSDPLCCVQRNKLLRCEDIAFAIKTAAENIGENPTTFTKKRRSNGSLWRFVPLGYPTFWQMVVGRVQKVHAHFWARSRWHGGKDASENACIWGYRRATPSAADGSIYFPFPPFPLIQTTKLQVSAEAKPQFRMGGELETASRLYALTMPCLAFPPFPLIQTTKSTISILQFDYGISLCRNHVVPDYSSFDDCYCALTIEPAGPRAVGAIVRGLWELLRELERHSNGRNVWNLIGQSFISPGSSKLIVDRSIPITTYYCFLLDGVIL